MSLDDEELARRLQYEEQSRADHSEANRRSQHHENLMDPDLARYYARLYLEQQARGNTSDALAGPLPSTLLYDDDHRNSNSITYDQYRYRDTMIMRRMETITPSRDSAPEFRDYHSRDYVRGPAHGFQASRIADSNYSPDSVYPKPAGLERSTISTYEHRRADPIQTNYSSRQYSGSRQFDTDVNYHDRPQTFGFDVDESARNAIAHSQFVEGANSVRMSPSRQSPDLDYARRLQEKELINLQQKRMNGHDSFSNHHEPVATRNLKNFGKTDPYLDHYSGRNNLLRNSLPATPDLEYARRLQELAFSDIQRSKSSSENLRQQESIITHRPLEVDADEELARRMQELENQGLGRLNSDKHLNHDEELSDGSDSNHGIGKLALPGQIYVSKPSLPQRTEDKDARLARLVQECNISVNQLPPDLYTDVMGSGSEKSNKSFRHESKVVTDDTRQVSDRRNSQPNRNVSPRSVPPRTLAPLSTDSVSSASSDIKKLPFDPDTSSSSILSTTSHGSIKMVQSSMHSAGLVTELGLGPFGDDELSNSPIVATSPFKAKRKGFLGFGKKNEGKKETTSQQKQGLSPNEPLGSLHSSTMDQSLSTKKNASSKKTKSGKESNKEAPLRRLFGPSSGATCNSGNSSVSNRSAESYDAPLANGGSLPGAIPSVIPVRREIPGVPPRGIPPPPPGPPGAIPGPGSSIQGMNGNASSKQKFVCAGCGQSSGTFLRALDRKYHPGCFRCVTCNGKIDPNSQFKFSSDPLGGRHPHHLDCYVRKNGIQCSVCRKQIPASPEGKVAFVKHPFFSTEHMCVHHAEVPHRRCSGCQRFEPDDKPFIDLLDRNRCVCPACFRTVIFDIKDAQQLWRQVIYFFEFKLRLPVWEQMVDIPILIVGSDELERQMIQENSIHGQSSQIMTAGVGLSGFGSRPPVVQILCLSGLPRDLTLSILTREATLAWFKLHPKYNPRNPLPAQVSEGIAQLFAFLFLSEAIRTSEETEASFAYADEGDGPSDERLRQYFKFTIERDNHEVYGAGYRRAAVAYREVGIETLLDHALTYRDFPQTTES